MFEKDPDKRIDISELIEHPWVTDDHENPVDLDMTQISESAR